jgi:hypothetical protein
MEHKKMKTNHHYKKMISKKQEIIKRSKNKYIGFKNRLDKQTNNKIDNIYKYNYKGRCSKCLNDYKALGKKKKEKARKKFITEQIKEKIYY